MDLDGQPEPERLFQASQSLVKRILLLETTTVRPACEFCGEDNTELFNFLDGENPSINQKLHRIYKITTTQELKNYLSFLDENIENIIDHVHFAELSLFADKNPELDWTIERGKYFEAIHHLSLDSHLHKCKRVAGELICHQTRLKVNGEPFRRFSRQWKCQSCRGTRTWYRDDDEEAASIHRMCGFKLITKPIQACTIELQLTPHIMWPEEAQPICNLCQLARLEPSELTIGRGDLMNSYFKFDNCICPFLCLDY